MPLLRVGACAWMHVRQRSFVLSILFAIPPLLTIPSCLSSPSRSPVSPAGAAASAAPIMLPYVPRHLGSAGIAAGTRFRSAWLPILRTRRCSAPPSGIGSGEAMGRRVSVLKLKKVEFVKRSETTRFSLKGVTVILRHDDVEKYFWHAYIPGF